MLEQQLNLTPVGQSILAENPSIFGAVKDVRNNEVFHKAGMTEDIGEVVGRLVKESKLEQKEEWELANALKLPGPTILQQAVFAGIYIFTFFCS